MRKRIITNVHSDVRSSAAESVDGWLDLESLAEVEITSEDAAHPIDSALLFNRKGGWRAAGAGAQTIRIVFLAPQRLQRIRLQFTEHETSRTQAYVLRWSPDGGHTWHEIVRQHWNFSPNGSTVELEDHAVQLRGVELIELVITPDISMPPAASAIASLDFLRLG